MPFEIQTDFVDLALLVFHLLPISGKHPVKLLPLNNGFTQILDRVVPSQPMLRGPSGAPLHRLLRDHLLGDNQEPRL